MDSLGERASVGLGTGGGFAGEAFSFRDLGTTFFELAETLGGVGTTGKTVAVSVPNSSAKHDAPPEDIGKGEGEDERGKEDEAR